MIGDDGVENIEIGQEISPGQAYSKFQSYFLELKKVGVLLTVGAKNHEETALAGLRRPASVLKEEVL